MKEQREELGNRIWNITLHEKTLHQVNWTEKVIEEMRNFEKDIVKAMKVKGWDGYEDETRRKWTFPGSPFLIQRTLSGSQDPYSTPLSLSLPLATVTRHQRLSGARYGASSS